MSEGETYRWNEDVYQLAAKREIIKDLREVAQGVEDSFYGGGGYADEIRAIANKIITSWTIGDDEE